MNALPWFAPAWAQFQNRLRRGQLAHALLLVAEPGNALSMFAERVASALQCRSPDANGDACGQCADCRQRQQGVHPDVEKIGLELNSKGDPSTQIKVDQIRALSAKLTLTAQRGGRKVALIEPADLLNTEAANALLKTLEEPPLETYLLLISEAPGRLPATILSRCQRIALGRWAPSALAEWLAQERASAGAESRAFALSVARGPLEARDAIDAAWSGIALEQLVVLKNIASGAAGAAGFGASQLKPDLPRALRILDHGLALALGASLGVAHGQVGEMGRTLDEIARLLGPQRLRLLSQGLQRIISGLKAPLKHDLLLDAWATDWTAAK
jgi:DNA polymerase III subunit delta'